MNRIANQDLQQVPTSEMEGSHDLPSRYAKLLTRNNLRIYKHKSKSGDSAK